MPISPLMPSSFPRLLLVLLSRVTKPRGPTVLVGGRAVISEAALKRLRLMVGPEQVLSSAGTVLLLLPTEESHAVPVKTLLKMAPIAQYRDRLLEKRVMPSFGAWLS